MSDLRVGAKGKSAAAANNALMGHNVFRYQTLLGQQNGIFTEASAKASSKMKWWLGYPTKQINLVYDDVLAAYLHGKRKRTPLMLARAAKRHGGAGPKPTPRKFIFPIPKGRKWTKLGWPYQGTHGVAFNKSQGTDNWESERAVDIGVPLHTPIEATADGTVGPQFGPLDDGSPRMAGIRIHLITEDDEFYMAHLATTAHGIKPGVKVKQGDILGTSGEANGVEHLHIAQKNGDPAKTFF